MTHRSTFVLALLAVITGCGSTQRHRHEGADYLHGVPRDDGREVRQRAAQGRAEAHIVQMHGSADAAHIERHLRVMEQRCGKPAG
jgi:hypothetical protein